MTDDFQRVRRRLRLAVVGMALGMFLAVLSQTVVATAMPAIIVELGGFGRYAWVATAYLVAATVTMPIAGRIADIYGCKRVLLAGIVLFTIASIPAGLSQTLNELVAYRALQGIGGGVVMIGSLVGMAQLFPPARRAPLPGAGGRRLRPGLGAGPRFGRVHHGWNRVELGVSHERPAWRDRLGGRRCNPSESPGRGRCRQAGLRRDGVAVACGDPVDGRPVVRRRRVRLVVLADRRLPGLRRSDDRGSESPWRTRTEGPILAVDIYRSQGVPVSLAASVLTGFGFYAALLFVPLWLFTGSGMSASGAGSHLTPMLLGMVVGAVVMGRRLSQDKGTHRRLALTSTGVTFVALFLMSTTLTEGASILATDGAIAVVGLGLGGMLATFGSAVQGAVPQNMLGAATSSLSFYRSVGGMLGVACAGAVLTNRLREGLSDALSSGVSSTGASVQLQPNWLGTVRLDPRIGVRWAVDGGGSRTAAVGPGSASRRSVGRGVSFGTHRCHRGGLPGDCGCRGARVRAVGVPAFGE